MCQFLINLLMQIQKGKVKHPIFDLHICNFILSKLPVINFTKSQLIIYLIFVSSCPCNLAGTSKEKIHVLNTTLSVLFKFVQLLDTTIMVQIVFHVKEEHTGVIRINRIVLIVQITRLPLRQEPYPATFVVSIACIPRKIFKITIFLLHYLIGAELKRFNG